MGSTSSVPQTARRRSACSTRNICPSSTRKSWKRPNMRLNHGGERNRYLLLEASECEDHSPNGLVLMESSMSDFVTFGGEGRSGRGGSGRRSGDILIWRF